MNSIELAATAQQPRTSTVKPAAGGALGAAAALIIWGLTMACYPYARVPEEYGVGMNPPPEVVLAYLAQQRRVDRINMMITFAVGGALLGGALAVVSSDRSFTTRLAIGIPGGAIWGAAAGFAAVALFELLLPRTKFSTLADTGRAQAAIFATLGFGLGALAGLLGRRSQNLPVLMAAGAVGGAIGGLLSAVLTALAVPSQSTQELAPREALGCALWLLVPFVLIGATIPAAVSRGRGGDV